jgi:hypothetical protein
VLHALVRAVAQDLFHISIYMHACIIIYIYILHRSSTILVYIYINLEYMYLM